MVATSPAYAVVPRLWPGQTVVCLGSGPSLTADDVAYCRGRVPVIAVKDAIRLAPWADVLYATGLDGSRWWPFYGPRLVTLACRKYTGDPMAATWADVLRLTGEHGLDRDPSALRDGHNSGYAAINLAVHFGASRVVLLGYDCGHPAHAKYFFGNRSEIRQVESPFSRFQAAFATLPDALKALGVEVVNATRSTRLDMFPKRSLEEALA